MAPLSSMRGADDDQDKQALLQDHKTTTDSDDNRSTDDYNNTESNTKPLATNASHRNDEHDSGHDDNAAAAATATTEYYDSFDVDDSETALLHGNRPRDLNEAENAETGYRLPSEGGSVFASFLNMSNSIIGAGIIGLPFSFKEAGFGMGLILLIVLTILVDWTVRLLIYNGKLSGRPNYQDLLEYAFGWPGLLAISLAQFVFAFGAMCAYCVIIGDTIPHVFRSLVPNIDTLPFVWIFANRRLCITFFTVLVSYPLSLYRDMSKLAKTSGLALITIFVIIVSVSLEAPKMPAELRGDPSLRFSFANDEIIQAVAVISFAFVCHHNSFMIFGSLRQPSMNRFAKVAHYSMALSFVTCTVLALSGYMSFTDKTAGNILNNFPADNTLINVARLAFGMNMFTTLPLEAFVCREVLEILFWSSAPHSTVRHVVITTSLVGISLLISLLTCNLGIVLELTGGFSATMLAYILPPLCYLKLAKDSIWQINKIPHWAALLFGLVIMIFSTSFSIQKVVLGTSDPGPTCDL